MTHESLHSILSETNIDHSIVTEIFEQGLEVEMLKLSFLESADGNTLDAYIKVKQAERFLMLLSVGD